MNTPGTEHQDQRDMARLANGEDRALNDLMDRYREPIFHFLIRLLQDETTAAELAQETFVRVYQHRHQFKANHKFSSWLYAIANNLARDRVRWLTRHPQVSLDGEPEASSLGYQDRLEAPNANPSEQLESDERAATVQRAVQALPEELRVPLILAEYEDRPQAEIAGILGCSVKAVEMRLYRARQHLRTQLQPLLATI